MIKRILLFCLFPTTLLSKSPISKDDITGNFDLGMNYSKNTETTFQFNNILLIKIQKNKSSFVVKNNISFINQSGNDKILNKGIQDFNYAFKSKKYDLNLTFNHMYDLSRSIKNRFGSGIGVSYNVINEDNKKIEFGISTIREIEFNLLEEKKKQNRFSTDIDFLIKPNQNISVISGVIYQPNIKENSDFRLKSFITFRVVLSPHFLLNINNTYNYDSRPENNVSNSDFQMINGISYIF